MIRPTGYRMLVELYKLPEKSKGGILYAEQALDKEQVACVLGRVLQMGPDCYNDPDKFSRPYCVEGDWVVFRSYSGTRIKIDGTEFRLINDDTVEAVVDDPTKVERV